MKKLSGICLLILISIFSFIDSSGNTNPGYTVNPSDTGKIKKQETTFTLYNTNGTISSCKIYKSSGELSSFIINKYTQKGNLSESVSYRTSGKQLYKNKIIYDASDSLKSYEQTVTYSESGGICTSASNYYNVKGELEKQVKCHIENIETNQLFCDTTYVVQTNDKDGRLSKIDNTYKLAGIPMQMTIKYSYDSLQNTETVATFLNNTLNGKTVYSLDKEKRYTKSTVYGPDGTMTGYETFEYNKKGNVMISKSFDSKSAITGKVLLINDKNGNPLKIENSDENGNVIYKETYKYKYDENQQMTESEMVKYY